MNKEICLNIIFIIIILFLILFIVFKNYKNVTKKNNNYTFYKVDKVKEKIKKYNKIKKKLINNVYCIDNKNYIENFKDLNNIYDKLENVNNNINNLKMFIPSFIDN